MQLGQCGYVRPAAVYLPSHKTYWLNTGDSMSPCPYPIRARHSARRHIRVGG